MARNNTGTHLNGLQLYIVLAFALFLVSCSLHQEPKTAATVNTASSSDLNHLLENEYSFDEIEQELNVFFDKGEFNNTLLRENTAEATRLIYLANEMGISGSVARLSEEHPERAEDFVVMALLLFPDRAEQTIEALLLDQSMPENDILSAALRAGIYPDSVDTATASGDAPLVVALINSASVTLFDQKETVNSVVSYRKADSDTWLNALPLAWEPRRQALSGSIVNLVPDTLYHVKVSLSDENSTSNDINLEFTTRPDKPPINPELVYQLSDIYSGSGTLDLTQLNIEGAADGWAKIVGDDSLPVVADSNDRAAISIGSKSYIMFENITVKGGRFNAITSDSAHHLWFDGCDVSAWGRKATYFKDGKAYEREKDTKPINFDAGFFLKKSGVVVIENCNVHSPTPKANHWGYGHPSGPSALLMLANHPEQAYKGQYIVRHNRFYGTSDHRFNDVIESRSNGRWWGGFLRDSAIHDNYLAYANDDIVELDGGQSNVLFYNNELEQGFCGVSAVPNMMGPSYIFNNHIHNLGDERGSTWAAIKLGGLYSAPAGKVYILQNLVIAKINGIAQAAFQGDRTYWAKVQNNIIINTIYRDNGRTGLSMLDPERYVKNEVINNFFYNTDAREAVVSADIATPFQGDVLDDY